MRTKDDAQPEAPQREKHARFLRLLTAIAAVPKSAIYLLDPSLRPGSAKLKDKPPSPGAG